MNKSELPPTTKAKSKNIELFTLERNLKLEYQGFCEISIRKATQLFEIISDDLDVVVPFQWQFFPNNLLILTSNFHLGDCVNGVTTLEIIQSSRKYLYQNFNRNSTFYCVKCKTNGKNVNARLRYNDKQESYLILNTDEHVCNPISI